MDFTLNVTFEHYSSGSLDRNKHRHSTIKVNIERMTFYNINAFGSDLANHQSYDHGNHQPVEIIKYERILNGDLTMRISF